MCPTMLLCYTLAIFFTVNLFYSICNTLLVLIGLKEVTVIGNLLLERGKKSWQFGHGNFKNSFNIYCSLSNRLLVLIGLKGQILETFVLERKEVMAI